MFCDVMLQEDDRKLLREIGTNGEGRPDEVQQLIDEVLIIIIIVIIFIIIRFL